MSDAVTVMIVATAPAEPGRQPRIPVGDWQFWAATLLAVVALAFLLRAALPIRALRSRSSRRRSRRATLTVEGMPVARPGREPDQSKPRA